MYQFEHVAGAPFDTYLLRDTDSDALVEVVPARGGMVTRFRVGERDVLYLDPATLADRARNVRGGIPVLFPIAGRLAGDRYTTGGATFAMKQHGFARNVPWNVVARDTAPDARITLAIASTPETRAQFPWDFEVRITYALAGATLVVEQEYTNNDDALMPLHTGFHPYFRVPDAAKARARIEPFEGVSAGMESVVSMQG
jgi:galactose mutarotase-like enzyme